MNRSADPGGARGVRALFVACGAGFAVAALLYDAWLVRLIIGAMRRLLHRPWIAAPDAAAVHRTEAAYLALAGLAFVAAWALGRFERLGRLAARRGVANALLAAASLLVPATALELALRPVTPPPGRKTALFVRDDALGWRMRPNVTQPWGGVTVRTNAAGLRGPDVPLARPAGTVRILWLGDSVTFGYRVARWQDVFPFVVARRLERAGFGVETIDAGVGGYAPWQERAWFERVGLAWHPDIVVLGFVLNDVTEMYTLVRYGGLEEGFQLRRSYASWVDRVSARSALVARLRKLVRWARARRRLGADPRLAAIHRERLDVESLIAAPGRPGLRPAWQRVFADLGAIADTCAAHGIDFVLVAFPFTMQLAAPDSLDGPQRMLERWARARGIRFVDTIPALVRALRAGATPDDLFVDADHFTPRGHAVVADTLARVLAPLARTARARRAQPDARGR